MANAQLGPDYERALDYAHVIHVPQVRKGTDIRYIEHPVAVAKLVLERGGTETEAIAALLHDAVEDQGGRRRLEDIRQRFGERVAQIVEGCSEWIMEPHQTEKDKPPWRERKERYLEHIRETDDASALLVGLADKVHNASAIVADLQPPADPAKVMSRFSATPPDVARYYRGLVDAFRGRSNETLFGELERLVDEMVSLLMSARLISPYEFAERSAFLAPDAT
jgi:(p)ppGpp synthase/HD superfamily hydrolase